MNHKDAIQCLEESDQYRILKRVQKQAYYKTGKPSCPKVGIVLDTETTGLDTSHDKIIELGFIAFEFDGNTGAVYKVLHTYSGFEDPHHPLSDEVKNVTGIADEMLVGQKLDDIEINSWLEKSDLIVAHNAAFDRQMMERRLPESCYANWACTVQDIDWSAEGIGSRKLDYIAYQLGYFFDAHRAVNDAEATLQLLIEKLPVSENQGMFHLLVKSTEKSRRFFAVSAPFDKKDDLKRRGYRWLADVSYVDKYQKRKKGVWSISVHESDIEEEQRWLDEIVYCDVSGVFTYKDITANVRYSSREFQVG